VQISRGIHSQVPQEDVVWGTATAPRGGFPQAGGAEGKQDRGGASDARSCAHDDPIPPKYAVSQVVGYIKGKSAIHLARVYGERKRNFVGQHFWARGYFVSTVGRDEVLIREYIRKQEEEDARLDQLNLWR
jgi:putative transposase